MAQEIERKFLVQSEGWRGAPGKTYRQGYLNRDMERTVRVRTVEDKAYLTIKGEPTGIARSEYEYEIPVRDADELLNTLCEKPLIEKVRYKIEYGGLVWEVDEFFGENAGLIMAEVELESEDQPFDKPDWIGQEVTDDARYYNANLSQHPFTAW